MKKRTKKCPLCKWSTYSTRAWQARLARHAKTHALAGAIARFDARAAESNSKPNPHSTQISPAQETVAEARRSVQEAKAQLERDIRLGGDVTTLRSQIQQQLRDYFMAEVRRQLRGLR